MTEQIKHIVLNLRDKYLGIHQQLTAERETNTLLSDEIVQLKNLLQLNENKSMQLEEKNLQLNNEIIQLNEQLESQKAMVNSIDIDKNAEIDELVREIDHCISQLKQ